MYSYHLSVINVTQTKAIYRGGEQTCPCVWEDLQGDDHCHASRQAHGTRRQRHDQPKASIERLSIRNQCSVSTDTITLPFSTDQCVRYETVHAHNDSHDIPPPGDWSLEETTTWLTKQATVVNSGFSPSSSVDLFQQGFDRYDCRFVARLRLKTNVYMHTLKSQCNISTEPHSYHSSVSSRHLCTLGGASSISGLHLRQPHH